MGQLAYGYKDRLEPLESRYADGFGWPVSSWFIPRWVVEWQDGEAWLHAHEADVEKGLAFVHRMRDGTPTTAATSTLYWRPTVDRLTYLEHARMLMSHIQRGDIYEVNYCIAHEAEDIGFDPFRAFERLLETTDAPFAGFLRMQHRFALCASPERFLSIDGNRMVGEPMKGTRPRGAGPAEDARFRLELAADAKERSENIMAVDVMRNDLSSVAVPGSVRVTGLCEVRSYPRVHQMVSVIEGVVASRFTVFDAVRAAFPMASMTGAPKIRAMQLIDAHEEQARGLFSGTLGFFAPDGTVDLNVVIRTAFFDALTGRISVPTGSALTAACDPESEWEECLLKFHSVANALGHAR
ncbi:MAG: anthranilate synthase component I family protein [Flavobacteriales bacterium]|nr:anthranilate synthase component I family protein [Flavobacteriales bacterium]